MAKITVAASPLTRAIYAGKAVAVDKSDPSRGSKWLQKEDVTQQAVLAVAQHLGQPGAYLELGGNGMPTMMLALLSRSDFALLEAARLANAKEKAATDGK